MAQKKGKSVQFVRQLNTMMCANMTTWVVTQEEERFLTLFQKIAEVHRGGDDEPDLSFGVFSWSLTEGLLDLMPFLIPTNGVYKTPQKVHSNAIKDPSAVERAFFAQRPVEQEQEPQPVLTFSDATDFLLNKCNNKVFIFKDIHNLIEKSRNEYPAIVRKIKDIIYYARTHKGTIIFLSPEANPPIDFENDVQVLDMPRPDDIDIEALLDTAMHEISESQPKFKCGIHYKDPDGKLIKSDNKDAETLRQRVVYNLRGLTESEISQIISYVCVKNKSMSEAVINDIKDSKSQVIQKTGFLEYIPTPLQVQVGGHERFKEYIDQRGQYLNKEVREAFHLKAPKGALSVGVPGSGKSILARYVAWRWNLPLIRLDFSAIFGKYLGESESRLREALKIASANAPCILWVDEIEKALGSSSSGDSGTASRVLGKLLTWMAERDEMVFMYCTANTVHKLPPELLRAGRFDIKFWADLPTISECKDILEIHCSANGIKLNTADIYALANMAFDREMTGAEIEQGIIDANFLAASKSTSNEAYVAVSRDDIETAFGAINPYASSYGRNLNNDRKKALQSFVFTSNEQYERVKNLPPENYA